MARYSTSLASKIITGTHTIVTPDSGAFTALTGTAPYTVTLPDPRLYPGINQTFFNSSTGTVTLSTPSGNFNGTGGSGTNTVNIFTGNVVSATSDGVNYVVISEDGSALVATSGSFSGNVDMNGGGATVTISPNALVVNPASTGSVNNVNIGASNRGTAAFTSLTANAATTLTANTTSTSTSSGTLVVTGGVGVSGAVNAGSVSASTVTGTLQTAAQPNITSVGTLSSLAVSGALSAGSFTVPTAAQPNITSLGTLTGLTVTNTITGNISGSAATAGTAGTVTTAAQPNITSVGTLTSLTVSGNLAGGSIVAGGTNNGANILYGSAGNPLTIGNTDSVLTVVDRSNSDWGITADKQGFDYGFRSQVASSATYAYRVEGSGTETWRVDGSGYTIGRGFRAREAISGSVLYSIAEHNAITGQGLPVPVNIAAGGNAEVSFSSHNNMSWPNGSRVRLWLVVNVQGSPDATFSAPLEVRINAIGSGTPYADGLKLNNWTVYGRDWGNNYQDHNISPLFNVGINNYGIFIKNKSATQYVEIFAYGFIAEPPGGYTSLE